MQYNIDIQESFKAAFSEHQQKNLVIAAKGYREILTFEPDHPSALHLLGLIEFEYSNYKTALDLIKKSLIMAPEDLQWTLNYAKVLKESNDFNTSELIYRKALLMDPNCQHARISLADLYYESNNFVEASRLYKKILIEIPDDPRIANSYVLSLIKLKKLDDADKYITAFTRNKFGISWIPPYPLTIGHLKSAHVETVKLDALKIAEFAAIDGNGIAIRPKLITESAPYKYLTGDINAFKEYNNTFKTFSRSTDNMDSVVQSIKQNGYPYDSFYICVYDTEDVVRDGRHRAAALRFLYGNIQIKIVRFTTTRNMQGWMPRTDGSEIIYKAPDFFKR